jgi:hypothetical protein
MLVAAVTFFLMGSVTSPHNQRDGDHDRRVERRVPSPLLRVPRVECRFRVRNTSLVGLPALEPESPSNYVTWTKAALANDSHDCHVIMMLRWSEVLNYREEPVPYASIAYQKTFQGPLSESVRRDGFASIGHEGIDSGSSEGLLLTHWHLLELENHAGPMLQTLRVNVRCARGGELPTRGDGASDKLQRRLHWQVANAMSFTHDASWPRHRRVDPGHRGRYGSYRVVGVAAVADGL